MEEDDDMIMIIVGDESKEVVPMPMQLHSAKIVQLKQDKDAEIDLESILRNAETNGKYLGDFSDLMDNNNLNTEVTEEILDEEYLSDSDGSDGQKNKHKKKVSYVAQLQKNFPKMRKDEDFLVSHITKLMKQAKPPAPPIGFCQSNDNQLVCTYCNYISPSLPVAGRHYQMKHGIRYLVCYACGSDFRSTTGLYKHEKQCSSPGIRVVLRARGRFLGRRGRQRPFLTLGKFDPWDLSNPDNRHHCSVCLAHYASAAALRAHEASVHCAAAAAAGPFRPFQCDQCPAAYAQSAALKRHLATHARGSFGRRCECDTCGRTFKTKTTLITHMNTHLPQRKYPCQHCSRRFAQKMALQTHVHRDHLHLPPPFACSDCPRRFPRLSNLKNHLKTKHGMTLMSRQTFLKALPEINEDELKAAKFVINSGGKDENKHIFMSAFNTKAEQKTKNDKSDHVCLDITFTTEETPRSKKEAKEQSDPYLETIEYGVKENPDSEDETNDESMDYTEYCSSDEISEEGSSKSKTIFESDDELANETELQTDEDNEANESALVVNEDDLAEEILGTPNDSVIRTVLPENCEIEFATTVAKTAESGTNDIEDELSKMFAESDEGIANKETETIEETINKETEQNTTDSKKVIKTYVAKKNSPFASKILAKKDFKSKTLDSVKKSDGIRKSSPRKTIGTRSDAMKTRSGTKLRK